MKKLFVILLITAASAAFAQSVSNFQVTTTDGKVTITKYTGKAAAVLIPARIEGKPVVEIGRRAFDGCTGLTSISILASITDIGDYAFLGCTGLTSVSIPASVTNIGRGAFYGCIGLTSISIPASVTGIGDYAFYDCIGLAGISVDSRNPSYSSREGVLFNKAGDTLIRYPPGKRGKYGIPVGVTSIGESAFDGCTGLTSVSIPASVTGIEGNAFSGCTGLTSISIPASVTEISIWAFFECTGLTGISVEPRNPSYSSREGVLFNKAGDTLISYPPGKRGKYGIPADVTSIGRGAFNNCTGLTSVGIPAGVIGIGDYAFYNCTGLTSVSIPANFTFIGDSAFDGCTGLTSIRIGANVSWKGTSFANDFDRYYYAYGKKAGAYTYRNGAWSYAAR
ncbi:hypothetical protein AGMMS49579_05930 [Spirochaetia bacterium]|nr:hypothetical protein AGMMS49579_05930 [Spirochaetia bacterium]